MNIAKPKTEDLATRLTEWVGTPASIMIHTLLFVLAFVFIWFGAAVDTVLLVLTTAVSLEAIYLAIFIQMTVNRNTRSLEEVEEDIEEIQEDVKEIETDVGEISEDMEELAEDMDKVQEIEEKETVAGTGTSRVSTSTPSVSRLAEGETVEVVLRDTRAAVEKIEKDLQRLLQDIEALRGAP